MISDRLFHPQVVDGCSSLSDKMIVKWVVPLFFDSSFFNRLDFNDDDDDKAFLGETRCRCYVFLPSLSIPKMFGEYYYTIHCQSSDIFLHIVRGRPFVQCRSDETQLCTENIRFDLNGRNVAYVVPLDKGMTGMKIVSLKLYTNSVQGKK